METLVNSTNFSDIEHVAFCPAVNTKVVFTVWVVVLSFCVPVHLLILYIGFKKWKTWPSANFSHSDVFTFNIILSEMSAYAGFIILLVAMYTHQPSLLVETGRALIIFAGFGQIFFHAFTCVDRYLAVVHPVIYLNLKKQSRVTARNITLGFTWPLCIGHVFALFSIFWYQVIAGILIPCLTLAVVLFCTIAVLCALTRPKPGETVRVKKSPDKSKRQAFYTIVLILAALMLKFVIETLLYIISRFGALRSDTCFLPVVSLWFGLPSSLVLPLLFLHRAGAVRACRRLCKM